MLIAADLGSRLFGWATFHTDLGRTAWRRSLAQSGTWRIWSEKDKRRGHHPGLRWSRLEQHLDRAAEFLSIDVVVYEMVRRHDGTVAAQSWGGAQAVLLCWASRHDIPVETVEVADVKAAVLGEGRGTKKAVTAAAQRMFRTDFDGPDAADAAAIGLAHLQRLNLAPSTPRPLKLHTADAWATAKCQRLSGRGKGGDCHFCEEWIRIGQTYARLGSSLAHYDCAPGLGVERDRWNGSGKVLEGEEGGIM